MDTGEFVADLKRWSKGEDVPLYRRLEGKIL